MHGFEVLAVTDETAASNAELWVTLERLGRAIPVNDAWIAALGIPHRLLIHSRNQHFDVIPGVERKSWWVRAGLRR